MHWEPTYAFTSATIHQFASAQFLPAPSLERTTLFGVAGSGADSVMAVGERGTILRYCMNGAESDGKWRYPVALCCSG